MARIYKEGTFLWNRQRMNDKAVVEAFKNHKPVKWETCPDCKTRELIPGDKVCDWCKAKEKKNV